MSRLPSLPKAKNIIGVMQLALPSGSCPKTMQAPSNGRSISHGPRNPLATSGGPLVENDCCIVIYWFKKKQFEKTVELAPDT